MALEGLETVLEMLRERSRYKLLVHPDEADEARLAVIKSHLVPQVQVVAIIPTMVRRGDAWFISTDEAWQFHSVVDATSATTETPIGA